MVVIGVSLWEAVFGVRPVHMATQPPVDINRGSQPNRGNDPYLWLEDVSARPDAAAQHWMRQRSEATFGALRGERFERTRAPAPCPAGGLLF